MSDYRYLQTAFKDLAHVHELIKDPEQFYILYYRLIDMFKEINYDKGECENMAMSLIAYPFTGKETLNEEELFEVLGIIHRRIKLGFFITN